jgi:hypothetical protein
MQLGSRYSGKKNVYFAGHTTCKDGERQFNASACTQRSAAARVDKRMKAWLNGFPANQSCHIEEGRMLLKNGYKFSNPD